MAENNNHNSRFFRIGSSFHSSVNRLIKTINSRNGHAEPRALQSWQVQKCNPLNILLVVPAPTRRHRTAHAGRFAHNADYDQEPAYHEQDDDNLCSEDLNAEIADINTNRDVSPMRYDSSQQMCLYKVSNWRRNAAMYSSVDSNQWSDSGVETNSVTEDYNADGSDRFTTPGSSSLNSKGRYQRETCIPPQQGSSPNDFDQYTVSRVTKSTSVPQPLNHTSDSNACDLHRFSDEFPVQLSSDCSLRTFPRDQSSFPLVESYVTNNVRHRDIHMSNGSSVPCAVSEISNLPNPCNDDNSNQSVSMKSLAFLTRWRYEPRCRKAGQYCEQYDNHAFELDTLT